MRGLFFPLFYVMVTADGRRRALSPMSAGIHPDLSIRIYCLSLPGSGRYPSEKHLTVNENKKAFCRLLCYNKSTTRRQFLHLLEREGILQEKDKRNRSPGHLEDLALKSAADYFGDEMIHWLGIREKALRSAPTREDMIPVLLSPLMAGKMAQPERILQGIRILRSAESAFDPSEIRKMEAILYAFAVKFLNNEDLSKVKEAIVMTKLGQMIWEDAVNQGREEGTQRYSRLILLLDQEKKPELIIKAASDPEYRESLYRKYGI